MEKGESVNIVSNPLDLRDKEGEETAERFSAQLIEVRISSESRENNIESSEDEGWGVHSGTAHAHHDISQNLLPQREKDKEKEKSEPAAQQERWYPGKYIGIKPRGRTTAVETNNSDNKNNNNSNNNKNNGDSFSGVNPMSSDRQAEEVAPEEGRRSSWSFRRFNSTSSNNNNNNNNNGNSSSHSHTATAVETEKDAEKEKETDTAEEETASTREEAKNENVVVAVARAIRRKYLERKLEGSIYLSRLTGVVSAAMTVAVTQRDVEEFVLRGEIHTDPLHSVEITGQYQRAISVTDTILNSLERRSRAWRGCEFAQEVRITRGTTLGVSDPFLGILNWSFTLELSATIPSLLASRDRFEHARDLARASRASFSLARSSFSFFASSKSTKSLPTLSAERESEEEEDKAEKGGEQESEKEKEGEKNEGEDIVVV